VKQFPLPALPQAQDMPFWQAKDFHALLHCGDIVLHTPKIAATIIGVEEDKRGAGITVARLAH